MSLHFPPRVHFLLLNHSTTTAIMQIDVLALDFEYDYNAIIKSHLTTFGMSETNPEMPERTIITAHHF
jgi:hypothetical protein